MGISREILKELSGVTTEHALSEMVAIFNLPAGLSLKLVQAVVKSGAQHIMGNCYDDIASRSLSVKEEDKHDRVFKIAENIFTKQKPRKLKAYRVLRALEDSNSRPFGP